MNCWPSAPNIEVYMSFFVDVEHLLIENIKGTVSCPLRGIPGSHSGTPRNNCWASD